VVGPSQGELCPNAFGVPHRFVSRFVWLNRNQALSDMEHIAISVYLEPDPTVTEVSVWSLCPMAFR
jgi:hypothetical protein